MAKPFTWLSEAEAAELAGLTTKTFRRYVISGKLQVRYAKITRKAKPKYVKADIEALLIGNIKSC